MGLSHSLYLYVLCMCYTFLFFQCFYIMFYDLLHCSLQFYISFAFSCVSVFVNGFHVFPRFCVFYIFVTFYIIYVFRCFLCFLCVPYVSISVMISCCLIFSWFSVMLHVFFYNCLYFHAIYIHILLYFLYVL